MSSPDAQTGVSASPESNQTPSLRIISKKRFALRILITAIALVVWFWTQSLLGARNNPSLPIGDALHNWTAPLNSYFHTAPRAADALLILSSGLIDAIGIFLFASWLFAGKLRPFLGLATLLVMRQIVQALCSLPPPAGMIWHYPGFPSLLVTYGVSNDFFFSGHTAIAVFGATEVARLRRNWLTILAIGVVVFEMAAVIVLRAHYTMDVFAGLSAALWVARANDKLSAWISPLVRKPSA
jgi:hypothetical protein